MTQTGAHMLPFPSGKHYTPAFRSVLCILSILVRRVLERCVLKGQDFTKLIILLFHQTLLGGTDLFLLQVCGLKIQRLNPVWWHCLHSY